MKLFSILTLLPLIALAQTKQELDAKAWDVQNKCLVKRAEHNKVSINDLIYCFQLARDVRYELEKSK